MEKIDELIDMKTGETSGPEKVDICLVNRISDSKGPYVKSTISQCSECQSNVWADNNTSTILKLGKAKAVCTKCFFEKYKDKLKCEVTVT